jgi:hypothetical protein
VVGSFSKEAIHMPRWKTMNSNGNADAPGKEKSGWLKSSPHIQSAVAIKGFTH